LRRQAERGSATRSTIANREFSLTLAALKILVAAGHRPALRTSASFAASISILLKPSRA